MSVGTDIGFWTYRGRTPRSWIKRLLNPLNYFKFILWICRKWVHPLLVLCMVLVLQFRPQSVYRFSPARSLPEKDRRLQKTLSPRDDFKIDWERTREIPPIGRASVILKGDTFDTRLIDQISGPVYAVNWLEKLDREDVVYVSADRRYVDRFVANEMFPILLIEINWFDAEGNYIARDAGLQVEEHLSDPRIKRVSLYQMGRSHAGGGTPGTSGLATVVVLSFLAESVQVYGWDFYLDFSPARTGYWKSLLKGFVNFGLPITPQNMEFSMYNWHYAYRFSQLPNFKIHGYLSGLEKHQRINQRLDKVFYNS